MNAAKSKDLTRGPITKQLIVLAAPLLVGTILQQLYNAADTIIVQRFAGDLAFSAVGVAGTVMNLFIFLLSGACTGISVVIANLYGGKEQEKLRCEMFMSTVFGLAFSLLLSGLAFFLITPLLRLIHTPAELMADSASYLTVIFLGMPATWLYNLSAAALRSVGNTEKATAFLIVSVVLNIILDILFVGPMKMGVFGAALATVLAQLVSAVCTAAYIAKKQPFLLFGRRDMQIDKKLLRLTVSYASASALNKAALFIGKLLVQGVVNTCGLDAISGFTAGSRIESVANAFGLSAGDALSVFAAQNIGAGNGVRARLGFKKWIFVSCLMGFGMSLLMYIPARFTVSLFISEAGGIEAGMAYLRTVALFYVICFADCIFVGWNRAAGETTVFLIGTAGQVGLRALFSWLLAPYCGVAGVGWATGIGWILLTIYKAAMYFVKKKQEAF